MILLCFAHLGEAQTFIKELRLKQSGPQFYQGDQLDLLITGEGPLEVLTTLPYYLGKKQYQKVMNLGIAGALDHSLELGKVYAIRTIYSNLNQEIQFHSYSTENEGHDCITADKRVIDDHFKNDLKNFAPIVDREAWALAKSCKKLKIDFTIYKLISDYAGDQTQCFDLKARALEFSDELYTFFREQDHLSAKKKPSIELPFKTSLTLERRIYSLLAKLNIKNQEQLQNLIKETGYIAKASKEDSKAFIKVLEEKIAPVTSKVHQLLANEFQSFHNIGASIHYPQNLESKKLVLKMEINSPQNITNLIKALSHFDYHNIEKIWDGEFDV